LGVFVVQEGDPSGFALELVEHPKNKIREAIQISERILFLFMVLSS
jgi:hypothetical protein